MSEEKLFACGLAVGLRAAAAIIQQHFALPMDARERAAWRIDPAAAAQHRLLSEIWEMADNLNAFGEAPPLVVYADAEIASWRDCSMD